MLVETLKHHPRKSITIQRILSFVLKNALIPMVECE